MRFCAAVLPFLLAAAAPGLTAGTIVLDFEAFSDSTPLTTQCPGVTFSNATVISAGITLNEFELPPHSGTNVVFDDGGPMTISFASPVLSLGGYFTYYEPITLAAFDALNNEVASATSAFSINVACGDGPPCLGDLGSSPNEFLQVAFTSGISRITITGDPAGGSFTLDDVTYTAVPEPSTIALLLSALLAPIALRTISHMKTHHPLKGYIWTIGLAFILMIGLGAIWLHAAPQASPASPVIGVPTALPSTLAVNTLTTVTITVPIPDPTVIPGSINLLRLGAGRTQQPTILGVMHDDGQNGDAVAGDHIYTLQVSFNEPSATQIQLQVSAAFRGFLRRVLSAPINIVVTIDGRTPLPPDPGPAGMTTIGGIDSDGDGIRDDVQRYIALNYTNSAKTQAVLTQLARAYLSELLDSTNTQLAPLDSRSADYGLDCLFYVAPSTASEVMKQLQGQVLNTKDRIHAYLTAEGNIATSFDRLPDPQQQKARCMVNPDTLSN